MTTALLISILGLAILAGLKPTPRQVELAIERAGDRRALNSNGRRAR